MMGGAEYEIHGKGFAADVSKNTIIFDQETWFKPYGGDLIAYQSGKT